VQTFEMSEVDNFIISQLFKTTVWLEVTCWVLDLTIVLIKPLACL
jgi:hypothetical protein